MIDENESWDDIYREYSLEEIPWHSDEPDENLVDLLKNKVIKIGIALDICSSA